MWQFVFEVMHVKWICDSVKQKSGVTICGWRTQSWQFYFSAMCKKREDVLWPDTSSDPQSPGRLMRLLIDENEENSTLTLKSDVEDMFRKMGFGKKKRKLAKA